jgi:L-lactate dehydrogenase complex protein LldF
MREINTIQPQLQPALKNPKLQLAIYTATGRLVDKRKSVVSADTLPDYQELRTQANALKKHAIDHLDHYLLEFERNVEANGGKVIWCQDGKEVVDFLLGLAKQRRSRILVKSKSMTTEEIHLNEHLEEHGLEAVETDLGEYILQLAHEKPYHIVAPALHMTRYEVADIFEKNLDVEREEVPEKQTQIARGILREKFLEADIGVSGANFLVADSGSVVLVENEGNARLSTTAPKVHVAVAGIEKIIPRAQDLATFLKLLGRSGTGQPLTVYTSVLSGPRRSDEIDGPEEFYVVLLDNGRTKVLRDPDKRQALFCIRCGACLNICPVYRKIGGHNYPWVYSGPIGAILTPQFEGLEKNPWLPHASSLCGACGEVCPVKIEIPRLLLELRSDIEQAKAAKGEDRVEKLGFQAWARVMASPKLYRTAVAAGGWVMQDAGTDGWASQLPFFMNVGPVKGWISERDLPLPAAKSFRDLWKQRSVGTSGGASAGRASKESAGNS